MSHLDLLKSLTDTLNKYQQVQSSFTNLPDSEEGIKPTKPTKGYELKVHTDKVSNTSSIQYLQVDQTAKKLDFANIQDKNIHLLKKQLDIKDTEDSYTTAHQLAQELKSKHAYPHMVRDLIEEIKIRGPGNGYRTLPKNKNIEAQPQIVFKKTTDSSQNPNCQKNSKNSKIQKIEYAVEILNLENSPKTLINFLSEKQMTTLFHDQDFKTWTYTTDAPKKAQKTTEQAAVSGKFKHDKMSFQAIRFDASESAIQYAKKIWLRNKNEEELKDDQEDFQMGKFLHKYYQKYVCFKLSLVEHILATVQTTQDIFVDTTNRLNSYFNKKLASTKKVSTTYSKFYESDGYKQIVNFSLYASKMGQSTGTIGNLCNTVLLSNTDDVLAALIRQAEQWNVNREIHKNKCAFMRSDQIPQALSQIKNNARNVLIIQAMKQARVKLQSNEDNKPYSIRHHSTFFQGHDDPADGYQIAYQANLQEQADQKYIYL